MSQRSKELTKEYKQKVGKTHIERAIYYGVLYESVNKIDVFNKAMWRCAMCGIKTPKKLMGKNVDNSPELDHIVPLSKGGTHTYSNVQCLCRKCNAQKHDMLIGQLNIAI